MSSKKRKKRKSGMFILIIILLLGIGITYFLWQYLEKNKVKIIYNDNLNIEINTDVTYGSLIKEVMNGSLLNGSDIVDTSKLGNQNLKVIVKDKKEEKKEFDLLIKIVDTTKPVIESKEEIKSYVGRDINLLDYVQVSDNSNEEIKAKVVGEYDLNKDGEYKLKYVVSDSSNNQAEYDFILNIVSDANNKVFTTSNGFLGKVIDGVTYIDGVLIVNKTYALPSTYGNGITKETQNAFNEMKADASKLGLNLWLASGYRSYSFQKSIYNNYVNMDGQAAADTYSARAGHSEHQTGLAFDLNTITSAFAYTNEGKWVDSNCYKYGLILRYPKGKDSITGYMYEPWHLRYVGVELATKLYNNGDWITLEEYFGIDSKYK